jgi:hypothetical protein
MSQRGFMHFAMKAEVPLLCLANKQDKPDAMSVQERHLGGPSQQIDYI